MIQTKFHLIILFYILATTIYKISLNNKQYQKYLCNKYFKTEVVDVSQPLSDCGIICELFYNNVSHEFEFKI